MLQHVKVFKDDVLHFEACAKYRPSRGRLCCWEVEQVEALVSIVPDGANRTNGVVVQLQRPPASLLQYKRCL